MTMEEDDCRLAPGHKVDGRWQVIRKLGQGSFGAVYEACDGEDKIKGFKALKLESVRARDQVLKIEVAVLGALGSSEHACRMYACGRNDRFNFLLMTLLGPSLSTLRRRSKQQRFGLGTTTYVTLQCLQAIRDMHTCGWLHRDIKPSNFAIGNTAEEIRRTIYTFDFGLARYMLNPDGGLREPRDNVGFRGTLRYCSVNGHAGKELGRHDDLISLLYMMVEMVKGALPWRDLDINCEVLDSKTQSTAAMYDLLPPKLVGFHEYLHTLRYEDKPDYEMFDTILVDVIQGKGYLQDTNVNEVSNKVTSNQRATSQPSDQKVYRSHEEGGGGAATGVGELPATGYHELT